MILRSNRLSKSRIAETEKRVQQGKHSRWSRHVQKLGGTPQMWTLLSFTGRFDPVFLEASIAKAATFPTRMPGERTERQKQDTRNAQIARARLRQAKMLDRLEGNTWRPFTDRQLEVLDQYRSGWLRKEANKRALWSGHGRLKRGDDSFVDIGGSTGGLVRTVLDDWGPPDLTDFDGDSLLGEDLDRVCGEAPELDEAQLAGGRAQSEDRRRSLARRS